MINEIQRESESWIGWNRIFLATKIRAFVEFDVFTEMPLPDVRILATKKTIPGTFFIYFCSAKQFTE